MKSLITIALLMASANAFALSQNNTWEFIRASHNVAVKAPTIAFDAGAATSFVSILDVCVYGEQVETLVAMDIYEHTMISNRNALKVIDHAFLTKSLSSSQIQYRHVGGASATTPVLVNEAIALDYNLDVVTRIYGSSKEGAKLFTKSFSIPNCN